MSITKQRLTVREALSARYRIIGHAPGGTSQVAGWLSLQEACQFYSSLLQKGYEVHAIAYFGDASYDERGLRSEGCPHPVQS